MLEAGTGWPVLTTFQVLTQNSERGCYTPACAGSHPSTGHRHQEKCREQQDVGAGRMGGAGRIWEAGRVQPAHGISGGWVLLPCSVFLLPAQESPPFPCLCCDVGSEEEPTSLSFHPLKRSRSHCYHSKSGQGRSWSRAKGQERVDWVWLRL